MTKRNKNVTRAQARGKASVGFLPKRANFSLKKLNSDKRKMRELAERRG